MKHTIVITFNTDRPITDDEVSDLLNTVAVQVEEPIVRTADGMDDATYTTTDVRISHSAI